ncbi:hypothetical protein TIFTF001_029869 [Ficus carica]|uniref:DDE Tnp4 domain-containing protein n=1 Tax=Ficus carica TaxID=3494 RepID=A0AA88J3D8_FICCA|nr:hypothetical protein TIFTF001_029869 [Ficus carica]
MNMNDHGSAHHHEDDNHETENGQRRLNAMAAMTVFATCSWRRNRRRDPVPMHNSSLTGRMRVNEILNGHPQIIQGIISMEAGTFRALTNLLSSRALLSPTNSMTLKDEFIRPPDYTAVQPLIQEHGYKYRPWLMYGCIGAIDGTHVSCVPPSENAEAWINRKGFHSQNVLAACSFDMKFTYMLAGYEGSSHDAQMLAEAIAFKDFPIPPPGKFYLGDSGYANKDCFLSPYRRETYHLPEYRRRRGGLGNQREVFNYTHSSLRNCIERTFGVWKARFKILKGINSYPMDKQAMIPVACAVLHNFIWMVQVGDPLHEEYAVDCMPVSGNVDVNADYVFEDVASGTGPSTGPQQHDTRMDAMNQVRDMMADDMWDRFQSVPWYKTT